MARTITFQPTAQTDFSNGNAMFANALSNMDNAFKLGQDTVKDFGQAVRDRNNALLNSVISGISQDDWAKPETQVALNNLITDMSDNTSHMVDLGKVVQTMDNRPTTLISRDNDRMENEQNRERHNNFLQNELTNSLAERFFTLNTPEQLNEYKNLLSSQPGEVQYRVAKRIDELTTDKLKSQTSQLTEQTNYGNAFVNFNSGTLNPNFEAMFQAKKPNASDEVKQAGKTASDAVASLVAQNPSAANQVMQAYNVFVKEQRDRENKERQAQQQHELERYKVQSTNDYRNAMARIAQQNANTNAFNAVTEANKAATGARNNSNSTAQKLKDEVDKSLSEVNLTGITHTTPDGNVGVNTPKMINGMMTNLVNIEKQFINESSTKTSYADWKIGEGKDVVDKLYKDSFWGNTLFGSNNSRLNGLENAFPPGISEAEKIKLVTALSSDTAKYARYFSSNDSPQKAIEGVLSQIRLSEQAQIKAKQRAYFNDVITKVAQTTGQPRLAVYNQIALASRDKTADVPDWVFTLDPNMHNEFMQQSIANMSDKQRKEFFNKHPNYDPNYKPPQAIKPKPKPTSNQRSATDIGADWGSVL